MPDLTPEQKERRPAFVVEPNAGVLLPLLGLVAAAASPVAETASEARIQQKD